MSAALRAGVTVAVVLAIGLGCWWMLESETSSPVPTHRAEPAAARPAETPTAVERPRDARRARTERTIAAEPDAAAPASRTAGRITVRVGKGNPVEPVAGAAVVLEDDDSELHSATTGADGVARFAEAIDGTYARIEVTASGLTRGSYLADGSEIRGGAECVVHLDTGVSVDGLVTEATDHRGISGARVEARVEENSVTEAMTAADGSFHLDGLPASSPVEIVVTEPRHVGQTVMWQSDATKPLDVRLAPAGTIVGTVLDPDGKPEPWATLEVRDDLNDFGIAIDPVTGHGGADGLFAVGGLPLGRDYRVVASRPGFADSEPVVLTIDAAHAEQRRDLVLRAPALLHVRAVLPGGRPADGAFVQFHLSQPYVGGQCDAKGECDLTVLASGVGSLVILRRGAPTHTVRVEIAPGESKSVVVELDSGVSLSGTVVDDRGQAVAGASVAVRSFSQSVEGECVTGRTGAFEFDGLSSGDHELFAFAPGHVPVHQVRATAPDDAVQLVMPRTGTLEFTVTAPPGERRELSVAVEVESSGSRIGHETSPGRVELPCDPGDATVQVRAEGFVAVVRKAKVLPGETTSLGEIALDAGVTLVGRVVDKRGAPVAGASVSCSTTELGDLAEVETDDAGAFRVEHLAEGRHEVRAWAEGFFDAVLSYELSPTSAPAVLTLLKGGTLIGTLKDADGKAVADVELTLTSPDLPATEVATPSVAKDGSFHAGLAEGRWRVLVQRGDQTVATEDVVVREGEETKVEIVVGR